MQAVGLWRFTSLTNRFVVEKNKQNYHDLIQRY